MAIRNCHYCLRAIGSSWIGLGGNRWAHQACYRRANPYKPKTFKEVLHNNQDQAIVRELLIHLVPDDVKKKIVYHFNDYMLFKNRRSQPLDQGVLEIWNWQQIKE